MAFVELFAPDGAKIVSTLELIPGTCGILGFDPATGVIEYDGNGTQVDWNNQRQRVDFKGDRLFLDENGKMWPLRDLKQEPKPEPKPLTELLSEARFAC